MANTQSPPLSPHLQVYRLPLSAVLSILHRLTGLVLILGSVLLTLALFSLAAGEHAYASAHALIASWPGIVVLVLFTFALYFHFCNGIRHLFWDAGYGFELSTVHRSALAAIAGSLLLTLITWSIAWV